MFGEAAIRHAAAFRRCLLELDVAGMRRLWAHVSGAEPNAQDDAAAMVVIHRARTEAELVPLRLRAYSHRWLIERGLPSGLPDQLRPRAERIYPVAVPTVGISVNIRSNPALAVAVRGAMSDAVADAFADGRTDPDFVTARMNEARERVMRRD